MILPHLAKWLVVLTVVGLVGPSDPVIAEKGIGGLGEAKFVPIKLVGVGSLNEDGTFQAQGDGTHLGKWMNHGRVEFLLPDSDGIQLAHALQSVFIGANQDELNAVLWEGFGGYMNVYTGAGVAMYEFQGGTGRFRNARGSAVLMVQFLSEDVFIAVLEGTILLPGPR